MNHHTQTSTSTSSSGRDRHTTSLESSEPVSSQFPPSAYPTERVRNHARHRSVGTSISGNIRSSTHHSSKSSRISSSGSGSERSGRHHSSSMTSSSSKQDSRSVSVPAKFDVSRYQPTVEDDEDEDRPPVPTIPKKSAPRTAPKEPSPLKQSTTPPDLSPPQMEAETVEVPSNDIHISSPVAPLVSHLPPGINMLDFLTPEWDEDEDSTTGNYPSEPPMPSQPSPVIPATDYFPSSIPSIVNSDANNPSIDANFNVSGSDDNIPPSYADLNIGSIQGSYPEGYLTEYMRSPAVSTGLPSPTVSVAQVSPTVVPNEPYINSNPPLMHGSIPGNENIMPSYNPIYPQGVANATSPGPSPRINSATFSPYVGKPPEWNAITRIRTAGKKARPPPPPPPMSWSQNSSAQSTPSMGNANMIMPYNPSPIALPATLVSPNITPFAPVPGPYYNHAPNAPQSLYNGYDQSQGQGYQSQYAPPPSTTAPSYNVSRPYYALEAPGKESHTVVGYELIASKLMDRKVIVSDSDTDVPSHGSIPSVYKKFATLQHRMLLHIQDEISEMEEQLRNLDEQCADATFRMAPSSASDDGQQSRPYSSRRTENRSAAEIYKHRTGLLGRIYVKLDQYAQALQAYRNAQRSFDDATADEVDTYKSFLESSNVLHPTETRFLDHKDDLLMIDRPKLSATSASGIAPQVKFKIPFLSANEIDLPSMLFLMVALLAGLSTVLCFGLFTFAMIVLSSYMPMIPFVFVLMSVFAAFCITKVLSTIVALDRDGILASIVDSNSSTIGNRVLSILRLTFGRILASEKTQEEVNGEIPTEIPQETPVDSGDDSAESSDSELVDVAECPSPARSPATSMVSPLPTTSSAYALSTALQFAPRQPQPQVQQASYPMHPFYMNMPAMRPTYPGVNPQAAVAYPNHMMGHYQAPGVPVQGQMAYPKSGYPMMSPAQQHQQHMQHQQNQQIQQMQQLQQQQIQQQQLQQHQLQLQQQQQLRQPKHQQAYLPTPPNSAGGMPPGMQPPIAVAVNNDPSVHQRAPSVAASEGDAIVAAT